MKTYPVLQAARPTRVSPLVRDLRTDLARWCLMAVLFTSAMIPWYALHLLPVVTVGTAKINLLDGLAACAALLALPAILSTIRSGPRELLWVSAFIVYVMIPLAIGVRDHEATFFAVREARALVFYALALAFTAGHYEPRQFRRFSAAFVAGAVVASMAVFAHVNWLTPLPGYPGAAVSPVHLGASISYYIRYLEWTVPVTAFTLGLAGALTASTFRMRLAWTASFLVVAWYILAAAERVMQTLAVAVALVLIGLWAQGAGRTRRPALVSITLAGVAVLALGAVSGPGWLRDPERAALQRWTEWSSDHSLSFRLEELRGGLQQFAEHPILGIGLGGLVLHNDPDNLGRPWRYVASGYGFLLIKTGLIGLILYLGTVITALRRGWQHLQTEPTSEGRHIALLGIVGLSMLLAFNVTYPAVDTPEGVIAFSLFYGMLLSRQPPNPDVVRRNVD